MPTFSFLRKVPHTFPVLRFAVLTVVGVGAIGLTYYYQHVAAKNDPLLHSTRVSVTTTASSSGVFTIPELGVQLTLPNGLAPADLVYYAQVNRPVTAADPHAWSTVSFSTKSLLQLDGKCTADEGSIGMIIRYTEDPQAIHAEVKESRPLGTYYFAFAAPQGSCTMNPSANQLENTQIGLLQQAFETISAAN